ncbi:MAG TPA: DUF1549 and DUF1553 domain-containing protein [Tepidisphaeraceae bacterium]|jgi:hypothetical protein
MMSSFLKAGDVVAKLEVFPTDIHLATSRGEQSIVCRVVQPDGVTRDVSDKVQWTAPTSNILKMDRNIARPIADGTGQLIAHFEGQEVPISVTVKDARLDRPISFKLDVMPVFMRAGCNVGSCHGSARGKDGFHLSLFGYDPDGDYDRITRELGTRRLDLAIPDESLLVQKGLGAVPHTGGQKFHRDDQLYNTLIRWIDAGAPQDAPTVAHAESLEILPKQMVLEGEGARQQMTVRAHYSDGTDRDVTRWALFLSNNENSATISTDGLITAAKRGEAFVMARFATFTIGSQVIVIPKNLNYAFPKDLPKFNYVDGLVDAKLTKLRIVPSPICTDEVFVRRAFIDVIGQLPTRQERDDFVSATDPDKRKKLIDDLLGRKEFVETWVMKFAELLKIRSSTEVSAKSALLYYNWLQDKIARDVPMDQIVQQLLASDGGTFKNAATNYYEVEREPLKLAEDTAQVFMGMQIKCSQCHNHPFDRWTMNDYYGFAAFFAQVGRKQAEDPRERIIFNGGGGEVANPVSKAVAKPKFLGGEEPDVAGKDRRQVLAQWLASPKNPYFAKNLANIVWQHFMGKGIVDPVDDVRISNPASNPELLEALGQKFQDYHYDFKQLVRDICNSRTYQTAAETNESNQGDERNFAHATVRRMRAEVMLDCLSEVTATPEKFGGLPLGARAVDIADGNTTTYFLRTFGRASRETVCSCEVKMEPNLSQALHLLNGQTIQLELAQSPLIAGMLKEKKSTEDIVEDLYLRCFGRKPTEEELNAIQSQMPKTTDKNQQQETRKLLDDVFWALLNSEEFMFDH